MTNHIRAVCVAVAIAVQTALSLPSAAQSRADVLEAAFSQSAASRGAENFLDELQAGQSDWSAICYIRLYGNGGAETLLESAKAKSDELLKSETFVAPTEYQRNAILLSAFGECPRDLIDAAVFCNSDLDRQGFNAYIWGLIAANASGFDAENGALHSRNSLAEYIISKQLPDGGFALRGESADADITAAAIYALAPLEDNAAVSGALERALERLKSLLLPSGGFASMGKENCESTAQALIAFSEAGLPLEDEATAAAYSALLTYRREDGGFAHLPDGKTNPMATAQAIEALTAMELNSRGESLFSAPKGLPEQPAEPISEMIPPAEMENGADESAPNSPPKKSGIRGIHITLVISILGGAAAVALAVIAVVRKKPRLFAGAAVCAAIGGGVWLLDIRTPDEYYADGSHNASIAVTVLANCENALSHMDDIDEHINPLYVIPQNGVVISAEKVSVSDGDSAFDALIAAAKEQRVRVDFSSSVYGEYISGIGGISEFGFGEMSGWMYRVNGIIPDVSAGAYILQDGDVVEFLYTCEMGDIYDNQKRGDIR